MLLKIRYIQILNILEKHECQLLEFLMLGSLNYQTYIILA